MPTSIWIWVYQDISFWPWLFHTILLFLPPPYCRRRITVSCSKLQNLLPRIPGIRSVLVTARDDHRLSGSHPGVCHGPPVQWCQCSGNPNWSFYTTLSICTVKPLDVSIEVSWGGRQSTFSHGPQWNKQGRQWETLTVWWSLGLCMIIMSCRLLLSTNIHLQYSVGYFAITFFCPSQVLFPPDNLYHGWLMETSLKRQKCQKRLVFEVEKKHNAKQLRSKTRFLLKCQTNIVLCVNV